MAIRGLLIRPAEAGKPCGTGRSGEKQGVSKGS